MKSRFLLVLVAMLSMALLAGCGEMSKSEYTKEMNKIGKKVSKDMDKMGSDKDSAKKAAKSLNEAADDMDDLNPPSNIKDAHEDLVGVIRDFADLMEETDPTSTDAAEQQKLMEKYTKIGAKMEKIQKAYKKAGYDDSFMNA